MYTCTVTMHGAKLRCGAHPCMIDMTIHGVAPQGAQILVHVMLWLYMGALGENGGH